MLFPGIKRISRELGLKRTDSVAVGVVGNIHVCLYDGNQTKVLDITFPVVSEQFTNRVSAIVKPLLLKKIEWFDSMVRITLFEILWPRSAGKIKDTVQMLAKTSKKFFPDQDVRCRSCNSTSEVDTYFAGSSIFVVCESCSKEISEQYKQAEKNYIEEPNRYVAATLFGLICSVPGILVSAVLFIFLDRVAALAAMLFVFLILWGYRKARGKTNPTGAILVGFAGLIMTLIGTAVSYFLNLWYVSRSFDVAWGLLARADVQSELQTNVVISAIVSIVFLIFQILELRKMWKFPDLERAYAIE